MRSRSAPADRRSALGSSVLVGAATVGALFCIAVGVVVAVQAATTSFTIPEVRVEFTSEAPPMSQGGVLAQSDEWPADQFLPLGPDGGDLEMWVEGADPVTAVLARARIWTAFLVAGVVVLALLPALRATALGRPFSGGTDRRLLLAGALTAAGAMTHAYLPYLGAQRAIAGEMAGVPAHWLAADFRVEWWPMAVAVLLVALGAAVRQGGKLAADTEGLV